MEWFTLFSIPILTVVVWLYTVSVARTRFPRFRNKAIVLLIAHPDDEAMFFAPTLLALTDPALGNHVKILCLSSGDGDGLGETRKKELAKSGMLLGLQKEDDVFVIESPEFPDSMTKTWSKEAVAKTLTAGFITPLQSKFPSSANSPPKATIQVLITFDSKGVSSHPNHISLYDGAQHFLRGLTSSHPGHASPIDLYTLTSLPIWRKYISIFDSIISMTVISVFRRKEKAESPSSLLFLSGPGEIARAREAMWKAHKSQMRWFRWGWIGLSRYMAVNDLVLEKVK